MSAAANAPSGPPTTKFAKSPPSGTRLVPIDLARDDEQEMLYRQRLICGWNSDKISKWKTAVERGDRTLFWITVPANDKTADVTPLSRDAELEPVYPVGHISLDRVDQPDPSITPDTSLASGDGTIMTITSLFVLPQFAKAGLGAFAMDTCERFAQEEPYGSLKCRAITIFTLSRRYLSGDAGVEGPDGMGRWELIGAKMPKHDAAPWYARRGYVAFKEEVRFFTPMGEHERLSWYGVFMRKELKTPLASSS